VLRLQDEMARAIAERVNARGGKGERSAQTPLRVDPVV
jgi:hypothetical protein